MTTHYTELDEGPQHYTDYEAALILLTLVKCELRTHSPLFRRELAQYPNFEQLFERHSFGSVSMRWYDFRSALKSNLKPTRGAHLKQIRRIIEDLEPYTGLSIRPDLPAAA